MKKCNITTVSSTIPANNTHSNKTKQTTTKKKLLNEMKNEKKNHYAQKKQLNWKYTFTSERLHSYTC